MSSSQDRNNRVSIIIPVYNGSNYLAEAINSALAQTYDNIEIIVVNDGSIDKGATEKVATSFGDKITYYHKENGGVASALNFGIDKMNGDYFSWLSHDDLYEPNKIEVQIEYLKSFKDKNVIVASNTKVLFDSGVIKKEKIDASDFQYFDIFLATSARVGLNGCSLLIPKKAIVDAGGFNIKLPVTQDYDLWFRLKDRNRFVLLDKYLVIYRRHDGQDSVKKQSIMLSHGDALHYSFLSQINSNRFENYFRKNPKNIKKFIRNYEVYKSRGYPKTSVAMLQILLDYYSNDSVKFCNLYNSEVGAFLHNKVITYRANQFELVQSDGSKRYEAANEIIKTIAPIGSFIDNQYRLSLAKERSRTQRLVHSFIEDGIMLTTEKLFRKIADKFRPK